MNVRRLADRPENEPDKHACVVLEQVMTAAASIARLLRRGCSLGRASIGAASGRVVCFGGATLDRTYHAADPIRTGTSNPAIGRRGYGGVARNVCENLARLGVNTGLVSLVGDDESGKSLVRHLQSLGVDTSRVGIAARHSTAEYAAILNPDNSLAFGIADMEVFSAFTIHGLPRLWPYLAAASWVFVDCNLPALVLRDLIVRKRGTRFKLAVDAVSTHKAERLPADLTGIDLLFLNKDEAETLLKLDIQYTLPPELIAQALCERGARQVVLTLGADGLIVASDPSDVAAVPAVQANPVDVTGAGDALIAGTLARLVAGSTLVEAARTGSLAAALTVECDASVHPKLSGRFLASMGQRLPEGVHTYSQAELRR